MILRLAIQLSLGFAFLSQLWAVSRPNADAVQEPKEVANLFPGTGFFIKNHEPYDDLEAKDWFLDAVSIEKTGDKKAALKLYEKFTKRRSDLVLTRNDKSILVGPEAIYRASAIREEIGDWKTSFDHLQLIAQAYPRFDFEKVANSLMRVAERLAKEKLPKKWGLIPRFRSGEQDRTRLNQIAKLVRGPRFAPRALMVLAEISLKDDKAEDAIDALERLINYYPESHLCEEAYFQLGQIYRNRVTGPSYDQGSTLKALNFFEDYLILFDSPAPRANRETLKDYNTRLNDYAERKEMALKGKREMRQTLAASKLEIGEYLEKYGKYYLVRWKELGNGPALQFYREAITIAPESEAAREAEQKVANLRND